MNALNSLNRSRRFRGKHCGIPMVMAGLIGFFGCGGGGGGTGGVPITPVPRVNNVQQLQVNSGPARNDVNGAFTSVMICVPGTATCTTIPDVRIDTGSSGLRILASQLSLSLPPVNDANGSPLGNCANFADTSFTWGPVVSADIQMADEKAASVPIQLINAPIFPSAPASCSAGGIANDTVDTLGANGVLGLGVFRQDCGPGCSGASPQKIYFSCPGSTCTVPSVSVPLANQLQNPVWLFPQDNNGVLISLPSVPLGGLPAINGTITFGIGTQSNNALGTAQVYTTDFQGNFSTSFSGTTYPKSFLDSGSNAIFFLDFATTNIPECTGNAVGFYCPTPPPPPPPTLNLTATNIGLNGKQAPVAFNIGNATTLFSMVNNSVFIELGGKNPGSFDWGLPFFFGRDVFTAIEGQTTPAGLGPYWAY